MRTHNYIFATLFGIMGVICLFSAIFLRATHQLFMAAIGLGMATVLLAENKKMKRHASAKFKATKSQMQAIINKYKI